MEARPKSQIVNVDRFEDGVVITFKDGRCAFYSTHLLDAMFLQAEDINKERQHRWHQRPIIYPNRTAREQDDS
jgi:hypothetical protein